MTNENLFSPTPEPEQLPQTLSRSEEFAIDHPGFEQPTVPERIIDPNARQANRQRDLGVGGGIADALDGNITFDRNDTSESVTPVRVSSSVPVQVQTPSSRKKRPLIEPRSGDSERDTGEPDYYGEPQLPTEEEKNIGRAAIQSMRDNGTLRNTHGRGSGK